jgi:hypothetical protein
LFSVLHSLSQEPGSTVQFAFPLANMPTAKTLHAITPFMTWCWNYLFVSSIPMSSNTEATSDLSCFPNVWKSISSQWTHWKWMDKLIMGRQMSVAVWETPLASFSRKPSLHISEQADWHSSSHVSSDLKCQCPCWPPKEGTLGSKSPLYKTGEPSDVSNPQEGQISLPKTFFFFALLKKTSGPCNC